MNIIQTTTGWLIKEEFDNFSNTTFIHQNTQTIKSIVRENNKVIEIYTLKLKEDSFTFSSWNRKTLKKTNKMCNTYNTNKEHIALGIRILKKQALNNVEKKYNLEEELFGIKEIEVDTECSSKFIQSLYQKPGMENLCNILFGDKILKSQLEEEEFLYATTLEAIYNCPWENKKQILKTIGIKEGIYMNIFSHPDQFLNIITKTNPYLSELINEYLDRKLPKIPQELKIKENIEEYLRTKIQEDRRRIPKCLEEIHSLLGDPVREKVKVSAEATTLRTDNLEIIIQHSSHFPMLLIESKIPKETEILLCEELGMRSENYTPSKLKKYKL